MTIEHHEGGTTITGAHIEWFALMFLRARLQMEIKGLKFRRSTYAYIKRRFGFRGTRERVLAQLEGHIATIRASADTKEPSHERA
jgi:hypothetical protein